MLITAMKVGIFVAVTAFCLALSTAQADWLIVSKMTSDESSLAPSMMPSKLVTKIKGEKVRFDAGTMTSTIYNVETRGQIVLDHNQRTFTSQSASQLKELNDRINLLTNNQNNRTQEKTAYKETGNQSSINGYQCKEYKTKTPFGTLILWMTDDFPNSDEVNQALKHAYSGFPGPSQFLPGDSSPPGFAVRFETTTDIPTGGQQSNSRSNQLGDSKKPEVYSQKTTTTILSVERTEIPNSEFEIPSNYSEFAGFNNRTITAKDQEELFDRMREQANSPEEKKRIEMMIRQLKDAQKTLNKNNQRR